MATPLLRGAAAYRTTLVESRSPIELVAMIYDGLVGSLTQARAALAEGDLKGKRTATTRALGMIGELQNTLDTEKGGEIARRLDALYTYISSRLIEANMNAEVEGFDEALKLVTPLRDAWVQIAGGPSSVKVPV